MSVVNSEYSKSNDELMLGLYRYRLMSQLLNISGREKWSIGKRNHFYDFLISRKIECKLNISFNELKERYIVTNLILREDPRNKYSLNKKTDFEREFKKLIKEKTRKIVISSFLIGKATSDFFIPSLGLIYEIDGSIHDKEFKIKKDLMKVDIHAELGIKVCSIKNEDIEKGACNSKTVKSLITNINKVPLLNSRTQKLILARIYLFTICCHEKQFEILFGIDSNIPHSYFMNKKNSQAVSSNRSELPKLDFSST